MRSPIISTGETGPREWWGPYDEATLRRSCKYPGILRTDTVGMIRASLNERTLTVPLSNLLDDSFHHHFQNTVPTTINLVHRWGRELGWIDTGSAKRITLTGNSPTYFIEFTPITDDPNLIPFYAMSYYISSTVKGSFEFSNNDPNFLIYTHQHYIDQITNVHNLWRASHVTKNPVHFARIYTFPNYNRFCNVTCLWSNLIGPNPYTGFYLSFVGAYAIHSDSFASFTPTGPNTFLESTTLPFQLWQYSLSGGGFIKCPSGPPPNLVDVQMTKNDYIAGDTNNHIHLP